MMVLENFVTPCRIIVSTYLKVYLKVLDTNCIKILSKIINATSF